MAASLRSFFGSRAMAAALAVSVAGRVGVTSSAQAARIDGCGRPPNSFYGLEVSAIEETPATCAGTTFMTTDDNSGATPPGRCPVREPPGGPS